MKIETVIITIDDGVRESLIQHPVIIIRPNGRPHATTSEGLDSSRCLGPFVKGNIPFWPLKTGPVPVSI